MDYNILMGNLPTRYLATIEIEFRCGDLIDEQLTAFFSSSTSHTILITDSVIMLSFVHLKTPLEIRSGITRLLPIHEDETLMTSRHHADGDHQFLSVYRGLKDEFH